MASQNSPLAAQLRGAKAGPSKVGFWAVPLWLLLVLLPKQT
jgi:hypothetical protein